MANKFAVVGLTGVVVSVVCLFAAAMIGGKMLKDSGGDFGRFADDFGFSRRRCDVDPDGKTASRSIIWNGSDRAEIDMPANVHYRPGGSDMLVVSGDARTINRVKFRDGKVRLDCNSPNDLEVTLPGRVFRSFGLHGSGDLTLEDIDQPKLDISMAGSGDVTASGKVQTLSLNMAGSGDAGLAKLEVDNMKVNMAGSGDVDAAPNGDLEVNGAGSGDVTLHSEPAHIESHMFGSGEIIHAGH